MELKVEKCHPKAVLPKRAHDWDAGLDLYAAESRVLFYQNIVGVRTGIKIAIPEGHFGLLAIRSSLGLKKIQLANAPGIIDAGYRGEIVCLMTTMNPDLNLQDLNYHMIKSGERIAQLVIIPIPAITPVWAENLPTSDGRETGGFGSSGKL